jgi:hypothetical protein
VARVDEGDTVVAVAPVLEAETNGDSSNGGLGNGGSGTPIELAPSPEGES